MRGLKGREGVIPDWKRYLRETLSLPVMNGHRDERMIDGIADHLDGLYREALDRGVTLEAAEEMVRRWLVDPARVADELTRVEPRHVRAQVDRRLETRAPDGPDGGFRGRPAARGKRTPAHTCLPPSLLAGKTGTRPGQRRNTAKGGLEMGRGVKSHRILSRAGARFFLILCLCGLAVLLGGPGGSSAQTARTPCGSVYPGTEWERIADPASTGFSEEGLQRVKAYADSLDTTGLLVVVGGKVLLEFGDVSEVTYVASVRKSILAMLYGKYVVNGTIDLKKTLDDLGMDDVGGLLPIEKRARVADLITARSGVYHTASNEGDDRASAPERGSKKPGTYFLYNNWDFNAAGAAFELMTGRDIFDALKTDLAEPLGFQDFGPSTFAMHKDTGDLELSRYPAYHMFFSTRDMARLGYLMLRNGVWDGHQVLPRNWAIEITTPQTPSEEMNPEVYRGKVFGYGIMWWTLDDRHIPPEFRGRMFTAQGAYGQFITVIPSLDMIIAHKTAVGSRPDGTELGYDRGVSWGGYSGILERIRAALLTEENGEGHGPTG